MFYELTDEQLVALLISGGNRQAYSVLECKFIDEISLLIDPSTYYNGFVANISYKIHDNSSMKPTKMLSNVEDLDEFNEFYKIIFIEDIVKYFDSKIGN